MSDRSGIEWTDATWNPVTGCVEVSEGCDHCYARTFAERFRGVADHPYEQGFDPKLWPERLEQPLRWKRPRMIFVNSMSDLFQDAVPDEFIEQVFVVMARATHHVFQVLTKRPGRMASFLNRPGTRNFIVNRATSENVAAARARGWLGMVPDHVLDWPLPNVWLGTSVESQRWADVRIPKVLKTPAAVRFLSCEPLLGPVDLISAMGGRLDALRGDRLDLSDGSIIAGGSGIGWVIVGGESGPGARPMHPDWARSLRDQCVAAAVPFFFKQWGGRTPKAGGRELDGRTWDELPSSNVAPRRRLEPLQV
jgi:protein gp37